MYQIRNSTRRGTFVTDKPVKTYLRQIPGIKYKSVPNELVSALGRTIDQRTWSDLPTPSHYFNEVAKPWQHEPLALVREYDKSTFLTYETGLGKSGVAAQLVIGQRKILIITSANHRYTWIDELTKWWQYTPGDILTIEKGTDWQRVDNQRVIVCTPHILHKCGPRSFSAIIFDESQAFKNRETRAWNAAHALVENNPDSIRVLLSATPAANEPKDLWAQLELLWPGRFGTQWQFLNRYCVEHKDEYGTSYSGINPVNHKELKARFEAVTYRATKIDAVLGGHVPPLVMQAHSLTREEDKLGRMLKYVTEAIQTNKHVGIFFFHPTSAEQFAERLIGYAKLMPPETIASLPLTGKTPAKKRMLEVERMRNAKRSISICTIEAMGEAIDLTYMERVGLCEYSYKPSKIIQFLGRFQRLSCMRETHIDCFAQTGTEDEIKVLAVGEKLDAISKCVREGASEKAVSDIMQINEDKIFEEAKARMTDEDRSELL